MLTAWCRLLGCALVSCVALLGLSTPAGAAEEGCVATLHTFSSSKEATRAVAALGEMPRDGGPRGTVLEADDTVRLARDHVMVLVLDSPETLGEVHATVSGYGGVRTPYDHTTTETRRAVIGPLELSQMHTGKLSVETEYGACDVSLTVVVGEVTDGPPTVLIGSILGILLSVLAVFVARRRGTTRAERAGAAVFASVIGAGAGVGFALALYERGVFDPLSARGYLLALVCAIIFGAVAMLPGRKQEPREETPSADEASGEPVTLSAYIQRHDLTGEQAIGVALCVLEDVQRMHMGGLVHGNISLETIEIADGTASLTGFSYAHPAGIIGDRLHSDAPYRSPEQREGRGTDARSDVYAIGGVLTHLLIGQMLYSTTEQHLAGEAPDLVTQHGLHPMLAEVLRVSVARHASDRYPSAVAFASALRDTAGSAYGPMWVNHTELPAFSEGTVEASSVEHASRRWSQLVGDALAGVVALALVVGVGSVAALSEPGHTLQASQSAITPLQARSVTVDVWDSLVAAAPEEGEGATRYLSVETHPVFSAAYAEQQVRPAVLSEVVVPHNKEFPASFSAYALRGERKDAENFDVFLHFEREKEEDAWMVTAALILSEPRPTPEINTDEQGYSVPVETERTRLLIPPEQLPENYVKYLNRSVREGYPLEEQFFQGSVTRAEIIKAANNLHGNLNNDLGGEVTYTAAEVTREFTLADGAQFLQFTAARRDRYSNSPDSLEGEECSDNGRHLSPSEPTDAYPAGQYRRVEFLSQLRITAMVSAESVEILHVAYLDDIVKPVPC